MDLRQDRAEAGATEAMTWRPANPNGWTPKLSPSGRWCLFGRGQVSVVDLVTGTERLLGPGYTDGWLTATLAIFHSETDAFAYDAETDTFWSALRYAYVSECNDTAVADGTVAGTRTLPGRLWRNAVRLATEGRLKVATAGGWLVTTVHRADESDADWRTYRVEVWPPTGAPVVFDPLVPAQQLAMARNGLCVYGGLGPLVTTDGQDVTATPWRWEGDPCLVAAPGGQLWLWTSTWERLTDEAFVIGRPLGSREVVTVHQPGIGLSVSPAATGWAIASCNDRGALQVTTVPYDASRAVLVQPVIPPVLPPATGLPRYDRPKWAGYFHSICAHGVHPEAPGNVQIIEEPGFLAQHVGRAIISPNLITEARHRWSDIVAIYVACETPDATAVKTWVDTARRRMTVNGLPIRPILTYTGKYGVLRDTGADWVGIQCYFTEPLTAQTWQAYWRGELSKLPSSQRVAIIGQAYDRRKDAAGTGAWTDEAAIARLQEYFADSLHDSRCVGLFWFAYGRPGGVLDYPSWLAWHRAIVGAIPGTPAVENLTVPPPQPPVEPPPLPPPTEPDMPWPDREEIKRFDAILETQYSGPMQRPVQPPTHVDAEGRAVWIAQFQQYRVRGESEARAQWLCLKEIYTICAREGFPVPDVPAEPPR